MSEIPRPLYGYECPQCSKYDNLSEEELKAAHEERMKKLKDMIPFIVADDPELKNKLLSQFGIEVPAVPNGDTMESGVSNNRSGYGQN